MGGSILVVEDELVTQRLIAASLERAGYKVTRARSLGSSPDCPARGHPARLQPCRARKLERLYPPDDRLTYVDAAFEAVRADADAGGRVRVLQRPDSERPDRGTQ